MFDLDKFIECVHGMPAFWDKRSKKHYIKTFGKEPFSALKGNLMCLFDHDINCASITLPVCQNTSLTFCSSKKTLFQNYCKFTKII